MLYLTPGFTVYCSVIIFLLGACMGSFLNCLAWRLVQGQSPWKGRSHCDHCGHVLSGRDLIPVVSFLLAGGKCRYCGVKLSTRYVWTEITSGTVFLALLHRYDISLQTLEYLLFASILLGCAFADLEGYMIPDGLVLAGVLLRIPFYFLLSDGRGHLLDSVLGGVAVGGGLLAVVLLYEKMRKIDAMGGGDIKLLCLTGLYLGWAKNLLCLMAACIIGIVFGLIAQRRAGEDEPQIFPWGPSIAAAAILTALFGQQIIDAYMGLF